MAQFFKVQIVNVETNEVYSDSVHFAKDYAACKQIPRNCVIDGEVSNSLQLTNGKAQSYAYFAHEAAEKGKVFYVKLTPQEFVNLNSRKFEFRAQMFVPTIGKLETPKGFFTKMDSAAIADAEIELPAGVIAELDENGKLTQESVNSIVEFTEKAIEENGLPVIDLTGEFPVDLSIEPKAKRNKRNKAEA